MASEWSYQSRTRRRISLPSETFGS
uniref:Uncharacterized protein n=1 Tax=Arundo donax TaxID=35708 RepID=A0A0A9B3G7_ARUDO